MTGSSAASLRGGAVGSMTMALAMAAHAMADGGAPEGSAVVLLIVVSIGVGALIALPVRCVALLLPGLFTGQLLAHIALSLGGTAEMHAHSLLPSTAMIAFHATASIVAALLIAAAERLYGPVTSIVRAVLALLTPLPDGSAVGRVAVSVTAPRGDDTALHWVISRRGPPVRSCPQH